jgi:hypothetical protein
MKKNIIEQPKKNRKDRKQLDGNLTVGIDLGIGAHVTAS